MSYPGFVDGDQQPDINGGILGNMGTPQLASWQPSVGMFGAALRDAASYLGGHPADATSVQGYGAQLAKLQTQQAARAAIAAMNSDDPAVRAKGYTA
jgi:hypothetical protein